MAKNEKGENSVVARFVKNEEGAIGYIAAWLLGVPVSIIGLWFIANQMGCGF